MPLAINEVCLNLTKPLGISFLNKKNVLEVFERIYLKKKYIFQEVEKKSDKNKLLKISKSLNLNKSGIILVGPYQGSVNDLSSFNKSLEQLQEITG